MKTLTLALLISLGTVAFSQEQKYYRVAEFFKAEDRYIYFHWSTDSAATAKVTNIKAEKGAIYLMQTKIMTLKQAARENKRNEKRIERANYPHINDIDQH